NQYRVILEAAPEFRDGPAALMAIRVAPDMPAGNVGRGGLVPLGAIAEVLEQPAILVVNREQQFPAASLSFNLAEGVALGQALAAIERDAVELGLPAGIKARCQGNAQAFEKALASSLLLVLAAVVTMYIVLGVLYESYVHPLTI